MIRLKNYSQLLTDKTFHLIRHQDKRHYDLADNCKWRAKASSKDPNKFKWSHQELIVETIQSAPNER